MSPHDTVNDERNAHSDSKAGAEFISTDLEKESPIGSSDEVDTIAQGILIDTSIPQYDKAQTAKVLRKIDYRLVPLLTIIYIISFIDRSNSKSSSVAPSKSCLMCYSWKRKSGRTSKRPLPGRLEVEHGLDFVFHNICLARSSVQHNPEDGSTVYLHTWDHVCLGHGYDTYGTCQLIWWAYCRQILSRHRRGRSHVDFCDRLRLTADRPDYSQVPHICSPFGTFGTKSRPEWSSFIPAPPCPELFLDFWPTPSRRWTESEENVDGLGKKSSFHALWWRRSVASTNLLTGQDLHPRGSSDRSSLDCYVLRTPGRSIYCEFPYPRRETVHYWQTAA